MVQPVAIIRLYRSPVSAYGMTPEQAGELSLAEQHEWYAAKHSRRRILRGGLVGAGAIAGTALIGNGIASAAPTATNVITSGERVHGSAVAPYGRHINFGSDPTSQMIVSWQVRTPVTAPFIRLGSCPGEYGGRVQAELRTLTSQLSWMHPIDSEPLIKPTTVTQYYLHVELSHLMPDTTYYYVVGHDGHDPAGDPSLGGMYSFRTAPRRPGTFTFTAFGDESVSYDAVANGQLIAGLNPAFHLHMGDLCYADTSGQGLITDSYDARVWDAFFVQNEPVAARVPWMVAVGNHDMEAWYSPNGYGGQEARFTFPDNGPAQCPGTYAWRYGNVGLISLDANDVSYAIPANYNYSGGAQTAWLKHTLAAMRADRATDFIVVYFHHSTYTTCNADGAEGGAQDQWSPLFDSYQVDLVLNGHNHVYERTDPIRAGEATGVADIGATIDPAKQGTTYVVAGGGGDSVYSFTVADNYEGNRTPNDAPVPMILNRRGKTTETVEVNWSRVRYTGYGLIAVDVAPASAGRQSTLTLRALTESGTEVDRFTLVRKAK
jgi:hypothetical protein